MATVYPAEDARHNRKVAVKVLCPEPRALDVSVRCDLLERRPVWKRHEEERTWIARVPIPANPGHLVRAMNRIEQLTERFESEYQQEEAGESPRPLSAQRNDCTVSQTILSYCSRSSESMARPV